MSNANVPILVVEDDPFPRILQVILDRNPSAERRAAFAHVVAHELQDFEGWCKRTRDRAHGLYPADVRLVSTQAELRANLRDATVVMVESLRIGREELDAARQLKAVQKYGTVTRNIDTAACAARDVKVLTLRRRSNIGCAEHALAMMLTFAKKLRGITGRISVEQLAAAGYSPTTFDRDVPASGWARVTGLNMLYESTLGIVGMGEIGRELALRAAALGMRVSYYQRSRLGEAEEREFHAQYAPLDLLLSGSDWISIHLPETPATRDFISREQLKKMKRGAILINVSRARIVNREAVIEALKCGHLGGYALDALYEEPGRADDELLAIDNVMLTPHVAGGPRLNGLRDFDELLVNLSRALAA